VNIFIHPDAAAVDACNCPTITLYLEEKTMTTVKLPYGKENLDVDIPDNRLNAVLVSELHHYKPELGQAELVKQALENPIGTPRLKEMAKGKFTV
jgi:nickel-dependent lactate racemase